MMRPLYIPHLSAYLPLRIIVSPLRSVCPESRSIYTVQKYICPYAVITAEVLREHKMFIQIYRMSFVCSVLFLVHPMGLEPIHLSIIDFESIASANSATSAFYHEVHKVFIQVYHTDITSLATS